MRKFGVVAILVSVAVVAFLASYLGMKMGQTSGLRSFADVRAEVPDRVQKQAEIFNRCEKEIATFCGSGGTASQVAGCLLLKKNELSEECRAQAIRIGAVVIPCEADIDRLCAAVPAGGGRVHDCLIAAREKLSADCLAAMPPSDH